jgi:hypothetical protein
LHWTQAAIVRHATLGPGSHSQQRLVELQTAPSSKTPPEVQVWTVPKDEAPKSHRLKPVSQRQRSPVQEKSASIWLQACPWSTKFPFASQDR